MPHSRMIPRRTPVIDCFTFNDELVLLEVRLRLLDSVVDRFVLVEADLTHQGAPKNLIFLENAHQFARWRDKITHVVVQETCRRTGMLGPERTINGEQ